MSYYNSQMNRLDCFNQLESHGWLGRLFKSLSADERTLARRFIESHAQLSKGEFELAINRMFLYQPKPRNWTKILELLSCANTRAGDQTPPSEPLSARH